MSAGSSQKFIARNRAPRVQIEYEMELYGSQKKVQLPFVMGVMSDLAGKSHITQPAIEERGFLEIDEDNFDDRMKAMQPRVAFSVPNTLTGDGNLSVDLTFEKLDDFKPGAIAAKIDALRPLLEARTQLTNLMAYMDGKSGAETLIEKILSDPALLSALVAAPAKGDDHAEALASLRDSLPDPEEPEDETEAVFNALRADPPATDVQDGAADRVLSELADAMPREEPVEDTASQVLSELADIAPQVQEQGDDPARILSDLSDGAPTDSPAQPEADPLDGLRDLEPRESTGSPDPEAALDALRDMQVQEPEDEDATADILSDLAAGELPEPQQDRTDDLLADLAGLAPQEEDTQSGTADVLANIPTVEAAEDESDGIDAVLADLTDVGDPLESVADTRNSALDGLADLDLPETDPDVTDDILADLADAPAPETAEPDDIAAALDSISLSPPVAETTDDPAKSALDSLVSPEPAEAEAASADDPLADLAADSPVAVPAATETAPEGEPGALDDLDALLEQPAAAEEPAAQSTDDLDDLLGGPETGAPHSGNETRPEPQDEAATAPAMGDISDDLGALLDDLGSDAGLDDLMSDFTEEEAGDPRQGSPADPDDELSGLLDGLTSDESPEAPDLDALLDDLDATEEQTAQLAGPDDVPGPEAGSEGQEGPASELDDLLADLAPEETPDAAADPMSDLDDLPGDPGTGDATGVADKSAGTGEGIETAGANLTDDPEFAFGRISAERPAPGRLQRQRFRLAIMGDFSGRSARGVVETGDGLASRRAILLDPDTAEDVIEGFATDLVLPVGKDGAGVTVPLKGLDDLHPDELFENVPLFAELVALKQQLASGATSANAAERLRRWGETHGAPVRLPKRSSGNAVPADLRLSDFQRLIGDTDARMTRPGPLDDLLARIVGPHVRPAPDTDTVAMQAAVDAALSGAMRLVLHHPEFQSLEAQWRSIDLIARSVETDDTLDVMLYDISAEEIAADLVSAGDLAESGFVRLLTEAPLDEETGRGGYSALIGLYAFEETPPHAELLGRIARTAAHVDAPFLAALSPGFLETAKEDRHPLVTQAWDGLRGMPEARYLGLVSPRFMLRRPYGARTEPVHSFDFEEFTMSEGLSGLLWANPVVLVAILLAQSFRQNGPSMDLGSIMSLGGMAYHYVSDRYGDQVALPCTERNLTQSKVEAAMARGVMPVVSIKGRDEIRLASFQSLGGGELRGPWSDAAPPSPSPPQPGGSVEAETAGPGDAESELDDLLAEFGEENEDAGSSSGDEDIDAELAALLEDL